MGSADCHFTNASSVLIAVKMLPNVYHILLLLKEQPFACILYSKILTDELRVKLLQSYDCFQTALCTADAMYIHH